jgi:transcriptional regulator NrdR family protein
MPAIADRMIYFCTVATNSGDVVQERSVSDLDRASTVKDIAAGQIEDLVQVIECNVVEGTSRDVTSDIARDVMNIWANEAEPLADWQYVFVEMFVSKQAADSFRRAA